MIKCAAGLIVYIVIMGAALAALPQGAQDTWKEYTYAADSFAVSAPVQPSFSRQDKPTATGNVEVHNYAIELAENSGVMISAAQFQKLEGSTPKGLLQNAKNGAISAVNATVTSEKEITLAGFPGLEFEGANYAFHMRVRMYIVKDRLITMMSVAPKDAAFPAGAERVFASLKLLNPAGK